MAMFKHKMVRGKMVLTPTYPIRNGMLEFKNVKYPFASSLFDVVAHYNNDKPSQIVGRIRYSYGTLICECPHETKNSKVVVYKYHIGDTGQENGMITEKWLNYCYKKIKWWLFNPFNRRKVDEYNNSLCPEEV